MKSNDEGENVVVPGVGTFGAAMQALNSRGLVNAIRSRCTENLPTFFICVGLQVFILLTKELTMQILFEESEESENVKGLSLFSGLKITRFPSSVTVPQHGWNIVAASSKGNRCYFKH